MEIVINLPGSSYHPPPPCPLVPRSGRRASRGRVWEGVEKGNPYTIELSDGMVDYNQEGDTKNKLLPMFSGHVSAHPYDVAYCC